MSDKKKGAYVYGSLKKRSVVEQKIFALTFVFILITGSIDQVKIPVRKGMFILFPTFYATILGVLGGPQIFKIVNSKRVKAASKLVAVGTCPFITKLGVTAGANIDTIFQSGLVLSLHGFGNLLDPLLTLPIAILLGVKREAIGTCHSINREYYMALVNNTCGSDSAEARGSLSIYIVGGMVGTIYFGLIVSVIGMIGQFHPQALGLASGAGVGIMMVSFSASLCVIYSSRTETTSVIANVGEIITGITGMYIAMLVAIPVTNKFHRILESKPGRLTFKNEETKKETV